MTYNGGFIPPFSPRFYLRSTSALCPPALAIIGGAALSATTISVVGGALAFSFSVGTFLVSAALGFALSLLAPKPPGSPPDQGYKINNSGGINPHAVIYGETVVGGPRIYDEVTDDNKYLHRIIALAGHECDSVQAVFFDDEALTLDGSGNITAPSKWASKGRIKIHLGQPGQVADPDLVSESDGLWTSSHVGEGICYLYVRLEFDRSAFPRGVPVITAKVRGKKVYDPRDLSTVWTDNAALCARDYLTAPYGLNATGMDDISYSSAANICDEAVSLAAGGTEARYTINGAFTLQSTPRQIVKSMHEAMAGYPAFGQGEWKSVTGSYTAATKTLNEDDLRSGIAVVTRHKRAENFNSVTGIFKGEETNWKETSYPSIESATFLAEDNGLENAADFPLPFTDTNTRAQRIGKIALFRQREQLRFSAKFGLNAFDVAIGDTVQFTYTRWGWSAKEFECVGWKFNVEESGELLVELTLREISSGVFDWNADENVFTANNTNLPDAWITSATANALSSELRLIRQKVTSVLIIDVTASVSGFVAQFEVEAKKSADSDWINLGTASGARFEMYDVDEVLYDVRSRSINTFGVEGPWTTTTNFMVNTTSSPPADVANFSANFLSSALHLSWDAVADLDLSHYTLRYNSDPTSNDYNNSSQLVEKIPRPATSVTVPARSGAYFIRAVDKQDNESINPTRVTTTFADIEGLNVVETIQEHTGFTGTYSGTVLDTVSINGVELSSYATAPSTGTYEFDNIIDLTGIYTVKLSAEFLSQRTDDAGDLFDSATGLFDDRQGLFDGAIFSDINVQIQVATTQTDPTGSPVWSDWFDLIAGDFLGWGFKFRAVLDSLSDNVTPKVTEMSIQADMQDRIDAGSDIVSGVGTKVITFSPAFKFLGGVGISAQGLTTGDYYEITSKSETGFSITFRDSSASLISRTFDYVAKGYGRIA